MDTKLPRTTRIPARSCQNPTAYYLFNRHEYQSIVWPKDFLE
jgi:hypothetical protein